MGKKDESIMDQTRQVHYWSSRVTFTLYSKGSATCRTVAKYSMDIIGSSANSALYFLEIVRTRIENAFQVHGARVWDSMHGSEKQA